MSPSPNIPDRVDLLERLQVQHMAINDVMRDALRTLDQALASEQRAVQRYGDLVDRHSQALTALLTRIAQHDADLARLEAILQAIKDLLNRPPNGH